MSADGGCGCGGGCGSKGPGGDAAGIVRRGDAPTRELASVSHDHQVTDCSGCSKDSHAAASALLWGELQSTRSAAEFWRSALRTEAVRTAPDRTESAEWVLALEFAASSPSHEIALRAGRDGVTASHARRGPLGLSAAAVDASPPIRADWYPNPEDPDALSWEEWVRRRWPPVEETDIVYQVLPDGTEKLMPGCRCKIWRGIYKESPYLWKCYAIWRCWGPGCDDWHGEYWVPCTPPRPRPPKPKKPRRPWWKDLPECPKTTTEMRAKVKETWDRGDATLFPGIRTPSPSGPASWCSEGKSAFHPGSDVCFRQVSSDGGPGQQCCYKGDSLVTEGAAAGTPDRVAGANAIYSDGGCGVDLGWVLDHYKFDVLAFDWAARRYSPDEAADLYHFGFLSLLGYPESRFPLETLKERFLVAGDGEGSMKYPTVVIPTEFGWPPSGSVAEGVFTTIYESQLLEWELSSEWDGSR